MFTVAFDESKGSRTISIKPGVGAYSYGSMTQIDSMDALKKELMK